MNRQRPCQVELKIGGIFPLTGYLSWSGRYKKKAAELKVEMINREGGMAGRPIRLVAYDDRSSAEQAALIAERLIFEHRVVAMVGTGSLPVSRAVAAVANRYRTPAFLNSGYAIDPLKDLFVFNTTHKTEFAVACSFQYFIEKGLNRLALLMPSGPLGELGSTLARRLSNRMGIQIVGEERFDGASPRVSDQLRRLNDLGPLALFSFVTGQPALSVLGSMAQLEMDVPLLVSHGNANPNFLKRVRRTPIQLIVPSGKAMALDAMDETDPCRNVVSDFCAQHMERYGEPANYSSAESSDAIDLVVEGLRRTGGADSEELRDAVESIRNFVGMQGVYDLSPLDHYGTRMEEVVLLTAQDGEWHFEKTFASMGPFEDLFGEPKTYLLRVLAEALSEESKEGPCASDGLTTDSFGDFLAGNPCRLPEFVCGQMQELSRCLRNRDFRQAKEVLLRVLGSVLLQRFESHDTFKLAIFEVFLVLFHSAMEDGNLEKLASLKQRLIVEWEGLADEESLCLWIVRAFHRIRRLFHATHGAGKFELFERVTHFIEDHLSEDLSTHRVAREVCLSPSRLIHRMRDEYHTTVSRHVTGVRMGKAKALLRDTEMSICAIAQEIGYNDQSHFTRVFKKSVGCTPMGYRRSAAVRPA